MIVRPPPAELPVAIAGFMGVGKSTVGRAVAAALDRPFFDTDDVIVELLGRQIPELFASGEELGFRTTEAAVIAELVEMRPAAVIALGGGALEYPPTRAVLASRAILVHLDLPWPTIAAELTALRVDRPLLSGRDQAEVRALYEARRHLYLEAPVQVAIGREGADAAARDVLAALAVVGVARGPARDRPGPR